MPHEAYSPQLAMIVLRHLRDALEGEGFPDRARAVRLSLEALAPLVEKHRAETAGAS